MLYRLYHLMKRQPVFCVTLIGLEISLVLLFVHNYNKLQSYFLKYAEKSPQHMDWALHVFKTGENETHLDVHYENRFSDVSEHVHSKSNLHTVAMGVALTSVGLHNISAQNLRYKFPFFRTLLPSFCKTSTQGYSYHFYVAFDATDPFFTNRTALQWFSDSFNSYKKTMCSYVSELHLHLIECHHSKKPAWAQNDAMMEAFLDDIDYYYRVNDDTLLKSPGWTELYIATLARLQPPNVGVVGPKHESGNTEILTYDFVHKKHIEIFGFYYPRLFTDWFADDWITSVYQPNRTIKLPQVKVVHTQLLGTRYTNQFGLVQYLKQQIQQDKATVAIYLKRKAFLDKKPISTRDKNVISMTIPSGHPDDIYGIIRNTFLARIYFPAWQVYVFMKNGSFHLQQRIFAKINTLGVKLHFVDSIDSIPASMAGYLIADVVSVDRFIIRNPQERLSQRDATAVSAWTESDRDFHCIRDHPSHELLSLVSGTWGAKRDALLRVIKSSMKEILVDYFNQKHEKKTDNESQFLQDILWPLVSQISYCHDSVSCDKWPNSHSFPSKRDSAQFVGMKFHAFEVPQNNSDNSEEIFNSIMKSPKCQVAT